MDALNKRGNAHHAVRASEQIAHETALFIRREASPRSLITVVRAIPQSHGTRITIFVSVFPESEGQAALAFLDRQRGDLSEHLKKARIKPLPSITFALDDTPRNP